MDKNVLSDARRASLMTQQQMATRLGVSVPTLAKWEKNPEEVTLKTLARILSVVSADGKAWIREYVADLLQEGR